MTRRRLPVWSKILVLMVLAVFAGTLVILTRTVFELRALSQLARQPAYIRKCLDKVAEFPNPLPAGYNAEIALDLELFNLTLVALRHQPGDEQLVLISAVQEQPAPVDSKVLLERAYDYGINTPSVSARFKDLKNRGTVEAAGHAMPYMIGVLSDGKRSLEGMIAALYLKDKKKAFLVYALEPEGKKLDPEVAARLLKNIKKF